MESLGLEPLAWGLPDMKSSHLQQSHLLETQAPLAPLAQLSRAGKVKHSRGLVDSGLVVWASFPKGHPCFAKAGFPPHLVRPHTVWVASRRKAVSGVSGTVWTLSGVLASATNFPSLVAIIGAPQLRLSWYPISKHVTKKQPMRMTHYIMAPSTMEGSRESRLGSVPSRSAVCKMSIFSCCA